VLGSAYGFLQGTWPFGVVEAIWRGTEKGSGCVGAKPEESRE